MTENATRTEVENTTAQNTAAENSAAENTESPLQIRFVPEFKAAAAARRLNARAPESHLATVRRARKINRILGETYPYAVAELDFDNPFELLIATVLSAQTTDVRVNSVTGALFARYPDAAALASARTEEVEPYIQSLGFYRAKARSIVTLSQQLVERHNGQVPSTLEELVELAGVGRKTANVVLGNAFDVPGLTVDTHFGRLPPHGIHQRRRPRDGRKRRRRTHRTQRLDALLTPHGLPWPPHLPRQKARLRRMPRRRSLPVLWRWGDERTSST